MGTFLSKFKESKYYFLYVFGAFCIFLPFQFALNPLPAFDVAIVRVMIPVMFLALLAFSLQHKKNYFDFNHVTKLIFLFLLLSVFSLVFSHNLMWSSRKILFLFSIFPVYFVAFFVLKNKIRHRFVIFSLVLGAALLAFFALLQFLAQFVFGINGVYAFLANHIAPFFLGKTFSQTVLAYPSWLVNSGGTTYMRATATFPDPHMLSYYLGMLIPWSIALWATSKTHRKLFACLALLLIFADIVTFTRGGYLALILGAITTLPLVSTQTIKKIFFASLILVIMFLIAPQSPVAGRLSSSFDVNEGSNQGRIYNWKQALPVIKQHPFGVGIGMYSLTVDPSADYREPIYAHDLYLDIAAELGIQTLLVFLILLVLTFLYFWQAAKKDAFYIAGVASITIFAVHSLVETPLYSVHVLTLFLIIVAISASLKLYEKPVISR